MEQIRLAQDKDLIGVLALYKELRPNDPDLSQDEAKKAWQSLLDNPYQYLVVAELEGKIASTCQLSINPTITNGGRAFAIIEHVITSTAFRRKGLSYKVMEKAIELAWQDDCYKVMLLSGEQRPEAHRLYEKLGFQSGIERGFVLKPD